MLLDAKRTPNWPQEGTLHESGGLWVSRHIGQSLPTKRITATSGRICQILKEAPHHSLMNYPQETTALLSGLCSSDPELISTETLGMILT